MEQLLQWAIKNSDGPAAPPEKVDAKWLDVILANPATRLDKAMDVLADELSPPEALEAALDVVLSYIESLDANDFINKGGLDVARSRLDHPKWSVRAGAAWVIGAACQNNPKGQAAALEAGVLAPLVSMISHDDVSEARRRALTGVSAILRGNPAALESFMGLHGFGVLVDLMGGENHGPGGRDDRLIAKALFLIQLLAPLHASPSKVAPKLPVALIIMDHPRAAPYLVALLNERPLNRDVLEQASAAVRALLSNYTHGIPAARKAGLYSAIATAQADVAALSGEDVDTFYDVAANLQDALALFSSN